MNRVSAEDADDTQRDRGETFEEFRRSFSYGSRTDLSFKFLAGLGDDYAGDFLQRLLRDVVAAVDSGKVGSLSDRVIAGQVEAYAGASRWAYDDGPFARPAAAMADTRIGLLTSSGHFVADDDPEPLGVSGMTQEEATRRISEFGRMPPVLSEIPSGTSPGDLRVHHGGYDIDGALSDPEVVLPLATLGGLARDGLVGEVAPNAYSFVGVTAQHPLIDVHGPAWVERFRQERVEAMLMVPA